MSLSAAELYACGQDTALFAKVFMPKLFSKPWSEGHLRLFKALDDDRIERLLIMAHRGFGKSTCMLAWMAKRLIYGQSRFIVPISLSGDKAIMEAENLKEELAGNEFIVGAFGDLRGDLWAKESWRTANGAHVFPRGCGQQVRGLRVGSARPDTIIYDDIENVEEMRNEVLRAQNRKWMFGDAMPMVDSGKRGNKQVAIGTPTHEDAIIMRLSEDPNWTTIRVPLCDENFRSLWPEHMSDARIQEMVETYRSQGLMGEFYREYMLMPSRGEDAVFTAEMFRYYDEADESFKKLAPKLEHFVIVDPAKTVNPQAAHTAIIGVGYHGPSGTIYIRDLIDRGLHADEAVKETHAMATRLKARAVGVELTGINEWGSYPFKTLMAAEGSPWEFIELKAKGHKEDRVKMLSPFYRKGSIFHNKRVTGALEAQLLSFPTSRRWDCMDAAAYISVMLEKGHRYFHREADPELRFSGPRRTREEEAVHRALSQMNWRAV